jgi:hypothetical protein
LGELLEKGLSLVVLFVLSRMWVNISSGSMARAAATALLLLTGSGTDGASSTRVQSLLKKMVGGVLFRDDRWNLSPVCGAQQSPSAIRLH